MKVRTLALVRTFAYLGIAAGLPALAQTAPVTAPAVVPAAQPLLPPAGLHYQYWPLQIAQWVGPELPYSMIVLYVDDRPKEPSYDAALTERGSGKRIHYVNKPELVAQDKAKGDDAFLTRMQFDKPDASAKGAQYGLRFSTEKGVPVLWQFVQGTDVSEQGSGVTPVEAPFPILLYREEGALAGEGTALKIGDVTSAADVWKEYAQPPYFVPYHGALTQGAHILSIAPIATSWTGVQPPLAEGAAWKLTSAAGTALSVHADSLKSAAATIRFANEAYNTTMTVEAQETAAGWAISRIRLGPAGAKLDQTLSLAFSPALGPGVDSKFDIFAGKKSKLASGSVQTGASDAGTTEKWTMSAPDWVKGKTSTASTSLQH
jgi:hypothetical protein